MFSENPYLHLFAKFFYDNYWESGVIKLEDCRLTKLPFVVKKKQLYLFTKIFYNYFWAGVLYH